MLNGALSHPDLDDPNKIILGPDYIDGPDTEEYTEGIRDRNGHGTQVAGIDAAETNNGIGLAGVAWNCKLMIIQVFNASGDGYSQSFYNGVKYAVDYYRNNPSIRVVINFSGGGSSASQVMLDAVIYAYNYGVTIVASSGNNNGPINYPAAYSSIYDNVIAVGATQYNDARAYYSNYGYQLNVVAPGGAHDGGFPVDPGDIFSTMPNYDVVLNGPPYNVSRNYGYLPGSSMAAPFVSGTAALMLSVNPGLTPSQIRNILQQTADDKGTPGFDNYYGYGRINAWRALRASFSPVISGFRQIPNPLYKGSSGSVTCNLSQGYEYLNFNWSIVNGNTGFSISNINSQNVTIHYSNINAIAKTISDNISTFKVH
jgi:serine protease